MDESFPADRSNLLRSLHWFHSRTNELGRLPDETNRPIGTAHKEMSDDAVARVDYVTSVGSRIPIGKSEVTNICSPPNLWIRETPTKKPEQLTAGCHSYRQILSGIRNWIIGCCRVPCFGRFFFVRLEPSAECSVLSARQRTQRDARSQPFPFYRLFCVLCWT